MEPSRRSMEKVTLMTVASSRGDALQPVIVYSGKQLHIRRLVSRTVQLVHTYLLECYLYYRDPPGVDSDIFNNWAKNFIEEKGHLRSNGRYKLLIYNGYSCHVKHAVLLQIRENTIVALVLPSHTPHLLKPLDFSMFSLFKSFIQKEVHGDCRVSRKLDLLNLSDTIRKSYEQAFSSANIMSGFCKNCHWNYETGMQDLDSLQQSKYLNDISELLKVSDVVEKFQANSRSLLGDVISDEGKLRIDTSRGANVVSGGCIEELEAAELQRQEALSRKRNLDEEGERQLINTESSNEKRRSMEFSAAHNITPATFAGVRAHRRKVRAELLSHDGYNVCAMNPLRPND